MLPCKPYHRPEDNELLGYLAREPGGTVPLTIFGAPLGGPGSVEQAEEVLLARGLACLADPRLLRDLGGEETRVAVLAAVVVLATEGADRLRPMR